MGAFLEHAARESSVALLAAKNDTIRGADLTDEAFDIQPIRRERQI